MTIIAMLPEMCAFEETQCYKDILMEGKIEGKIEAKKEMARALKEKGVDPNTIMEVTGLSLEEIEQHSFF